MDTVYNREVLGNAEQVCAVDATTVAARLEALLADPAERVRLAAAQQREVAQRYRWDDVCDGYRVPAREARRDRGPDRCSPRSTAATGPTPGLAPRSRLASYALFEGKPVTTSGQWFNPVVRANLALGRRLGRTEVDRPVLRRRGRSERDDATSAGSSASHPDVGFLNEPELRVLGAGVPDEGHHRVVPAPRRAASASVPATRPSTPSRRSAR